VVRIHALSWLDTFSAFSQIHRVYTSNVSCTAVTARVLISSLTFVNLTVGPLKSARALSQPVLERAVEHSTVRISKQVAQATAVAMMVRVSTRYSIPDERHSTMHVRQVCGRVSCQQAQVP
jgi:hypothetical protein